jgi:hypothetical protein
MPLAEANFIIHSLTILSRMPLTKANLINIPILTCNEHNIFVIAFLLRIKLHKCERKENYAPAPPVSWPPLTEDPFLVASPESQGNLWSCFLQAKCYSNSIFIHYTYGAFHACLFSHHNIQIHIKYIFKVGYINMQVSTRLSFCQRKSMSYDSVLHQQNSVSYDSEPESHNSK